MTTNLLSPSPTISHTPATGITPAAVRVSLASGQYANASYSATTNKVLSVSASGTFASIGDCMAILADTLDRLGITQD
jgi:hypothetical protein